ncbi:MAG: bifunctional demethylmenaquinone methyltransferase/2-methoxy-6-polyprenyl-1,4-benzoquinol methylase UbiE [Bacteroidales bacterium]|nr:MAG: bifunctional demethylmenaquinone methyltransferase/2-methoxy-6-polyprenyl-1,4-benzoquinol methylase UbiE [Bacteroidales bacterium]
MSSNSEQISKTKRVEAMFNDIAPKYDFLNHFLSLGIDRIWRRKVIRKIVNDEPTDVLDIATGTADLAIMLAKKHATVRITGVDLAENMLAVGRKKVDELNLSNRISLKQGDSLSLPFENDSFDCAMVAFGVRNYENPVKGMEETLRVLRSHGKFYVLEFSKPRRFPLAQLYRFYFRAILPLVGRMVSGHKQAYTYLPESVSAFSDGNDFILLMEKAGFLGCKFKKLSFGIATIYEGVKG